MRHALVVVVCFSSIKKVSLSKNVGNVFILREKITSKRVYYLNPQEITKTAKTFRLKLLGLVVVLAQESHQHHPLQ